MMSYFGGFGWMSVLTWAGMLLFWGGLFALAEWALRSFVPRDGRSSQEIARDALQRRYAAGEITNAEYQQAMKATG